MSAVAATGDEQGRGPRHVAIIMDGNGRWAKRRHLPRVLGHQRGVEAVRRTVRAAVDLGLSAITLYAFSTENWRRPEDEVSALMGLLKHFILADIEEFARNNIRLKVIGDYKAFAPDIVALIEGALQRTAGNTGLTMAVALNYGSQDEIVRAARAAAAKGEITTATIAAELDTADMPPLDLIIRTSGEVRLSNFLMWQAAYAEMLFLDVLWPDFGRDHLEAAIAEYTRRERRFGGC
ncbi:undecaprenyl pyrophosphate synthetase [Novosphingobium nitrogenifigens DSM 19370]|uniref:Isoprenyl transferase n=1 Tax=Novosphingobium nitrogenifigens DSM 19370 TaxID=983920 RepID=F1ZC84_9SPHN|nr:polyprenyl diphosphate synthase [Novosphingobium nitrogenifigens]EGD57709.1 undecaprenyl pyrophosphate synthetase [Novosphingobium nitrogenifigens DSM 19370]